ncbi:MAG: hypothetical protein KAW12_20735 [Candidatus Aminicenantes bacterium]|nr:hypothetical protein [Candidatus Aminicenantes bacterium]
MDYWHLVDVKCYPNLQAFFTAALGNTVDLGAKTLPAAKPLIAPPREWGLGEKPQAKVFAGVQGDRAVQKDFFFFTKKGERSYHEAQFRGQVYLFFGKETGGLPGDLLARFPDCRYRIPMRPEARSLNLSNAAAVVLYEAFRQNGFPGLAAGK